MNTTVKHSQLFGNIVAPLSKSYMHRALFCASASNSETYIPCTMISKDIERTIDCLNRVGAEIVYMDGGLNVTPVKMLNNGCKLDCGESGSTLRFLLPFVSALGCSSVITGTSRLAQRPIKPLCDALCRNGAFVECSEKGSLPIKVHGGIVSSDFSVRGDISSQFITGLLIAVGTIGGGTVEVTGNIASAGYVDITVDVMKSFGIDVEKQGNIYKVHEGRYNTSGKYTVQSDWSNGAFWLAAGALNGDVNCLGLTANSAQGDRIIADILKNMGADIEFSKSGVRVKKSKLHSTVIDAENIPDLVPVLSVIASGAEGITEIFNVNRLHDKESDRVVSTVDMINNLGGKARAEENKIFIEGTKLTGGTVDSYNDHRIVMSSAVASTICENDVVIKNAEAVKKSYPDFFDAFKHLGGKVK